MKTLNETQVRVLLLSLPTGIIDAKSLFGSTEPETRRLRAAFSALHTDGCLCEHIVARDTAAGRDFRRSYLTQKGIDALCDALPMSHLLQVLRNYPVNIRSGRNDSHLSRMVRYADVSCFLACAGARTVLTCPLEFRCDPFFVGAPSLLSDSSNLEDIIKAELVRYSQSLPDFSLNSTGAVYFQADYIHSSRKYNNNMGILVDFSHKDGYMVFKSLFRKPLRWYGYTYTSHLGVYHNHHFKEWGLRNTNYLGNLRDAVLVVDTKAELLAYLDHADKYTIPFSHLFVFFRRIEGFTELHYLLEHGLVETREAHLAIAKRVYGVTGSIAVNGTAQIDYHGAQCYLGTIFDIVSVARWKKKYKMERSNGNDVFFLCFEDQVEYYSRAINPKYLLPIPRN